MRGYHVRRKAGWDTHGLPVELEVERELGLKNKKDIEAYGIEAFNKKCKESVLRYIGEWKEFTDRIGFWVDHNETYFTFANDYIESVWNILKRVHERGLLYKDYRVVPWCARCGTSLSSHEVADGYADVTDTSVYVKFKVKNPEKHNLPENTYLLAWTTTPWTLPGNVALAVGNDIEYVLLRTLPEGGDVDNGAPFYILAKSIFEQAPEAGQGERMFGSHSHALGVEKENILGNELIDLEYEPLFPYLTESAPESEREKLEKNAYKVYAADFVSTDEGTGIVHTAVMYGQDDFELGTKVGLPKHHLINEEGKFSSDAKDFVGVFVKDADEKIINSLEQQEFLFDKKDVVHTYPHCWRCKKPLIYYARDSWYIKMSQLRDELVAENQKIRWEPEHIRDGRFGEWLREVKDWAISRSRYWGTPLPIWVHEETGDALVIGSVKELRERAVGSLPEDLDLHRPYIDDVKVKGDDGREYVRVPEVLDVWFDSGSMPFAQDHYPFDFAEGKPFEGKELPYPADFISEAIDQTRGWFYTLHAIGILMERGASFKNVISLGHLLDKKGKKMSKSVGNVIDPWEMIPKYGVDALRFWMYTVNEPGASKNFDERTVDEIVKKNSTRLLNVLSFYSLYRDAVPHTPSRESAHVLDRWIVARMDELIKTATDNLDVYKVDRAARPITDFIDDLSTWYIRRSRDRFKASGETTGGDDQQAALATTSWVLREFAKVLAPFMPFIAEHVYREVGGEKESVHLATWSEITPPDTEVLQQMQAARNVVSLALEKRAEANIKVRQPLAKISVKKEFDENLKIVVADEINVKDIVFNSSLADDVELDTAITPELKREGQVRDFVRAVQDLRKKKGLKPGETAQLVVVAGPDMKSIIEVGREEIMKVASLSDISFADASDGTEVKIGEQALKIKLT
jgi:isoleucyl-tRNA synthetase